MISRNNKALKTSNVKSSKNQTTEVPKKEEFEGMIATRVKETIINQAPPTNSKANRNFCTKKKISEVPLELEIEQQSNLQIPKLLNSETVKVSMHLLYKNPICDVYSDYVKTGGHAGCDAWLDLKEIYYIPGGMDTELFKKKDYSAQEYIDKKIFDENFFENSVILYFEYFFYDYSDDSYSTNQYDIYFKTLSTNMTYKYHVYSRENESRKLTCYCDESQVSDPSVCFPWDLPVSTLKK